ncbi:MAG: arylesterase [Bacteroidetes bacterium]|jgi:acyl-CoA thioesterase-1|nr:arylesterase [Bacteroidota bacterium]
MKPLYLPRFLRVLLLVSMFTIAGCGSADEADPPSRESPAEGSAEAPTAPVPDAAPDIAAGEVHVLVLGNSIAAGLGLSPEESFPALLQDRAEARGWPVQVTNAGVSGDTSAGGLSRIDWLLDDRVDILIIELGGNDGLRGLDPSVTQQNLGQIIETARDKQPGIQIILGSMQIPPNMGQAYTARFRGVYQQVAAAYDVPRVPIVPDDLASVSDYIQDDGIHPTAEGQELIASNVWETLGPMLEAAVEERTAAVAE